MNEFLKTFFVKRFINNQQLDTKSALAIYLEPLKRMAEPEEWGPKDLMLVNYFVHTFMHYDKLKRNLILLYCGISKMDTF